MSYNLFLDDFRDPMDVLRYIPKCQYYVDREWDIVRNYDEFVKIVTEKGIPQAVSFDHDLADEHYSGFHGYDEYQEKTGYDCAKWLIDYCIDNNQELPIAIFIHSMNPVGSRNIESLFNTYKKVHGK
jgi:hypothetical protein